MKLHRKEMDMIHCSEDHNSRQDTLEMWKIIVNIHSWLHNHIVKNYHRYYDFIALISFDCILLNYYYFTFISYIMITIKLKVTYRHRYYLFTTQYTVVTFYVYRGIFAPDLFLSLSPSLSAGTFDTVKIPISYIISHI